MLEEGRFARTYAALVALGKNGLALEASIDGLQAKHRLFCEGTDLEAMLKSVFTAKRRLDLQAVRAILDNTYSSEDRKLKGAAEDFAAEWRHFRDPQAEPLATRWALDALRELGAAEPDPHAGRAWIYERLRAEGVYRDHHWWADLTLALTYVEYLRAMTGGILGSDFTRAMQPQEQLTKLLGISTEEVVTRLHAHT